MNMIWEQATPEDYPILAYHCYLSSLPDNKGHQVEYMMRLPYKREDLERRQAYGRDLPEWFIGGDDATERID